MPRNLDTALVRAFVTVADTASMTVAAQILNLSQAAVSQQIKRLEDGFDCSLFRRDRRGLTLTDEGERLFGKAKRLLSINDDIWAHMTTPAFKGKVTLGIPYDLVGTYLPPVLKSFAAVYPQVEISLVCLTSPELTASLKRGELDLAVVEEPLGKASGECLATDRLVWAGARGGEAFRKRPLPLSSIGESCAFRPVIFAALRQSGLEWRVVSEIGNLDAISATVQTDLAIMALLARTVGQGLEILGPQSGLPDLPQFSITLLLPRAGATPIAQALAQQLREGFLNGQAQAA